jgi:parallel beta-helix repeat protein
MTKLLKKGLILWLSVVLIAALFPLAVPVLAQTAIPGGSVSGTWTTAGSPYHIEGDITVPTGQTLTIQPGVEVIFQSWYKLTVNGTLLAEGTASNPILFTGSHATAGWLGIRFIDAPDGSLLTHVVVEKGRATGASPEDGGGGIYIENSSPTISFSTIRDNFAKRNGGGLYLVNSNARLIGNGIANNSAGQGASASGGGIFMLNSNPELTGNVISGNWVYVSGSYTTPTGAGGGIFARSSNPVLSYNVISDNRVDGNLNSYARGGGLYLYYADPDLINNTITGNTVGEGGGVYSAHEGGGLFLYQSDPTIVNTILWNDTPQEIFVSSGGVSNIITVAFSDLQGGQAAIVTNNNATVNWLAGNIDADPLFVDPVNADYQLQSGSPAIDAGSATFEWQGRVLVDLSPDAYVGAAPDMGGLESDSAGGGQNQTPLAVASASPNQGSAPLTVQFSSDGSYDPDGTIITYAWAFGDGSTASEANPSRTYVAAGIYQATLTVTDDGGATDSTSVTVTVTELELHVGAQAVTREKVRNRERGVDTILILDQDDQPLAGATVTALYYGPNSGQVSGTTGADGTVVLETSRVRRPKGTWCFEVTGVSKDGYVYNPGANVATVQCES